MTCSGIVQRYYISPRNCHTCRYYIEEEHACMHPRLGEILTHFLDDPNEACPFWEGWEEYREHGEGD